MARVLIVDDDVDIGEFLGLALSRQGHDVRVATSGSEAHSMGVEIRPDVLIIDWMLAPGVDGIQVARVLRAGRPRLQVILITGRPSEALESRAAAAGIHTVLAKPLDLTELTGVLDAAGWKRP